MKRFGLKDGLVASLLLANVGCATITTGTTQPIAVETDPPGAECSLTRGRAVLGKVTTPGTLTVKRHGQPITVECKKDGYEDSRTVMNAQAEKATYANAILGGWVGMMIDQSSGANSRYEASVKVELTAMSEADRDYVEMRKKQGVAAAAAPQQAPAALRTSPAATPAGPYDGAYAGSVEVLQTNVDPPVPHLRQFNVRVVNGVGTGTVKHVLCDQPGEVFFVIDTAGVIRGKANTQNTTGCTERMAMIEGHMNGSDMTLTLQLRGQPEFTMARASDSAPVHVAVVMPAVSGPHDGEYGGGLELASGDLRQVWLRVVGTKGTGNVRHASCRNVGLMSIAVAPDGAVTGNADVLNGPACGARKATVKGRLSGKELAVNLVFEDGTASREFVFAKRSKGAGVDD